ncbi:MAG: FHIPEP family type III secretion protein [Spirochaetia bacterium]|nr:FHIPEP family type III secretion protein [Spirochaetia bacterium]
MNKFLKMIRDCYPIVVLMLGIFFIFIPLPMFVIEVLLVLDYMLALFLFWLKTNCGNEKLLFYTRFVISFCLLTCGIMISTLRTFLTIKDIESQLPIVRVIGTWICRENIVCGFFTTLLLCGALILFCKLFLSRHAKIGSCYCFDAMNTKLFNIDNLYNNNLITEEEANCRKEAVRKNVDYFSSMDGAIQYYTGTIVAFMAMYVIEIVGGFSLGMIELKLTWQEALWQYVMLSTGYLILFTIPIFIVGLTLRIAKEQFLND